MASFSVAVVAKEDQSIIERLADYYLGIGAKHITIYYDGTADFEPAQLPGWFTFIQCNERFWKEIPGGRPKMLEDRQAALYAHALDRTDADWQLIVDSDELLVGDEPARVALDLVPAGVDVLRIPNAEAIWSSDDDANVDFGTRWFRWPIQGRSGRVLARMVYGRSHRLLESGVAGYSAGKQFLRTKRRYEEIRLHCSIPSANGSVHWISEFSRGSFFIAHYDAISFERWKRKFLRRYEMRDTVARMRSTRADFVDLIGAKSSDADLQKLFRRIYCVAPLQLAVLRLFNLAFKRDISRLNRSPNV